MFSESSQLADKVLTRTSSGGACVNDIAMHVANPKLPFGGVGPSGLGAYHGQHGFDSFSHKKAVFIKMGGDPSLRFPPYTASKLLWLSRSVLLLCFIVRFLFLTLVFARVSDCAR